MLCCKRSSSQVNNLLPFEYRVHLLNAIQESVDERQFANARKKLQELKKVMAVELTPKNGQFLQFPHMLRDIYVVERHAHVQIQRLEEAMAENKLNHVKNHCSVLKRMFGIPTDDEILHQIQHENTINLKMIKKTDRHTLRLYNCDLLQAENLKLCYRILRSCHELRKVELQYCKIDDRTMGILFKALARLPELMYLGLKGNNLTTKCINRVEEFLEERENFQQLMWIDMSVNNGINSFPKSLVDGLVERWPRCARMNIPSKDIKLSPLDIIQGRIQKAIEARR